MFCCYFPGNACVLYVFYNTPRLRTVTSYYIITLAISDVTMAVLVMPFIIAVSACGCDVLGALGGDIVYRWIMTELLFGSLQTTSLIAVNRYFCVVKPAVYRKHFRPKKVISMIVSCWVFTLAPIIVMNKSIAADMKFYGSRYMSFPIFAGPYTAHIVMGMYQVLFTILPATLSTVCYWKIHKQIKSHKASLATNRTTNGATSLPVAADREVSVVSNQAPPSSNGESSIESNGTSPLPVTGNQASPAIEQITSLSSSRAVNPSSSSVVSILTTASK